MGDLKGSQDKMSWEHGWEYGKLFEGSWLAQPYIEGHYDSTNGIKIKDGHIKLPTGSGLGIIPDDGVFSNEIATY